MCVAIIITGDNLPTLNHLQQMHNANSDGAGVGWINSKGRAQWLKGLKPEQVDKVLQKVPRPCLVHFRFATVGGAIPELTHPFPVTEDMATSVQGSADEILIHNGHWSDWDEYYKTYVQEVGNDLPGGVWSDTRFAAFLMAKFPEERDAIAAEVGGRVAILSARDGISYYGDWVEDQPGLWYSNMYWKASPRGKGWMEYFDRWEDDNNIPDYAGQGQTCGSSHRYVPYSYRGHSDAPPPVGADDTTWDAYLAKKYGVNFGSKTASDFSDEPTQPESAAIPTATEEFAAVQAAIAGAVNQDGGTATHQLKLVTQGDNSYYILEPRGE
jgi:hypothetical protein